tara:strand:+ start:587 stop:1012 length:426 start_codon:yes stop_codon:yes gene_type:complete
MKTLKKYESPFETLLGNWLNDEFIGLPTCEHSLKTLPAVNLIENNNNFSIELAAPGYDKKDFKIELDNYQLSVSLEKNTENNSINYSKKEFDYSSFSRSFKLPKSSDLNKINAAYQNGILNISIAKKKEAIPLPVKSIKIA